MAGHKCDAKYHWRQTMCLTIEKGKKYRIPRLWGRCHDESMAALKDKYGLTYKESRDYYVLHVPSDWTVKECPNDYRHFIDGEGKYVIQTWDYHKWYDPHQTALFKPPPCSMCQPDEYAVYKDELDRQWAEWEKQQAEEEREAKKNEMEEMTMELRKTEEFVKENRKQADATVVFIDE
jgi:hypothetical protein